MTRRFQFSLRALLVAVLIAGSVAWAARWVLYPPPLDVSIEVQPYSFVRYDDFEGHLPLGAVIRITNLSESTAWFLGYPGTPVQHYEQLVDGRWDSHTSAITKPGDGPLPSHWTPIRSMESVTILIGPISERATEVRVGVPFTTERLTPREAHWIFSPAASIVKRGGEYFAEIKEGAQQEEQVVSLRR